MITATYYGKPNPPERSSQWNFPLFCAECSVFIRSIRTVKKQAPKIKKIFSKSISTTKMAEKPNENQTMKIPIILAFNGIPFPERKF